MTDSKMNDLLFVVNDHISHITSKKLALYTTRTDIWVFGMYVINPKTFSLIPTDRFISLFGKKSNSLLRKIGGYIEWEKYNEITDLENQVRNLNMDINKMAV